MHLTDPHLFASEDGDLRGTKTQDTLISVLDHVREQAWPADIALVTGDIVQDDSAEAYQRFCTLLADLGLPVYCIPGNHDVRELMREALDRPGFYYCEDLALGDWRIINIDSCKPGSAGGDISEPEMQRLRASLAAATEANILVCLHHPPLPMNSRWLDSVGLRNADEFLDAISVSPKVRCALFGHVHQAFESSWANVRIIGTPSTCRQFKVGSDEFAVDENPPAYRRISLASDGSIESELIWVS